VGWQRPIEEPSVNFADTRNVLTLVSTTAIA